MRNLSCKKPRPGLFRRILPPKKPAGSFLWQHRAIRQEVSDIIFAPIQSLENEGILYVFLVFQTEEVGQKDGGDSQTQLCGVALGKDNEKAPAVSRCFWQRMRDSNPRKRSQSPVCYRYTNPLYPFGNVPIISNLSEKSRKIFRVPGKFFTVGVWGRKHPVSKVFPPGEFSFCHGAGKRPAPRHSPHFSGFFCI